MKCPNCGKKLKKDTCKHCGYTSVEAESNQQTVSSAISNAKFYIYDPSGASYSIQISGAAQPNPALDVISSLPTRVQGVTASAAPQEETKSDDDSDRKLYIGAGWLLILHPILSLLMNVVSRLSYTDGGILQAFVWALGLVTVLEWVGYGSMFLLAVLCFVKAKKSGSAPNIPMGILFSVLAGLHLLNFAEYGFYLISAYRVPFYVYIILAHQVLTMVESIGMAVIFFKGRSGKGSYVPAISEILQILLLAVYYGLQAYFNLHTALLLLLNLMMAAALFLIGKAYKE